MTSEANFRDSWIMDLKAWSKSGILCVYRTTVSVLQHCQSESWFSALFPWAQLAREMQATCSVEMNGGSQKPGLNRNFSVSAGKEHSYLIHKVIRGTASCSFYTDVCNCAFCVEMAVKRILYRNWSSISQSLHFLGRNSVAGH